MATQFTLKEIEAQIAALPEDQKAELIRSLLKGTGEVYPGIRKTPDVMGGSACIRKTRIPVWLLEAFRRQGATDEDLLRNYPGLNKEDIWNAWDYVLANKDEIDGEIIENERED